MVSPIYIRERPSLMVWSRVTRHCVTLLPLYILLMDADFRRRASVCLISFPVYLFFFLKKKAFFCPVLSEILFVCQREGARALLLLVNSCRRVQWMGCILLRWDWQPEYHDRYGAGLPFSTHLKGFAALIGPAAKSRLL